MDSLILFKKMKNRSRHSNIVDMNNKLNYELAKQYYSLVPRVSLSSYGLMFVIIYFFWNKIPSNLLIAWGVVVFLMAFALLVVMRMFVRHGSAKSAEFWLNLGAGVGVLHDAPLGLIVPMGFMVDDSLYHILTLFMIAGMSAGAIITRGVVFKIYVIAVVVLLTPTIITLVIQNTVIAEAMLVLTVIYVIFMLSVARNYSSTIRNNFLLWLDNEKLVSRLTQSHSAVEDANRELIREIERRKRIEGELVEAKERSEKASEAKNQFLANVSHELRTPLNGIIGFSDLLHDETLEVKEAGYVEQIGKSAKTLLHIVNDILDITAIEAGHLAFYEESFSLRDEMNDVITVLRPMAERKNLAIELSVDEDVDDYLYGDANRVRQIISNLITNAVKYTEKGNIDIHVSYPGEMDDKVMVRFEIKDTGIGISEEAQATIFDNFTRVEGFEVRHNEGVGLGLAIVKNLLQRMAGTISVSSKPGAGSCFTCEIPFARSTKTPQSVERDVTTGVNPVKWGDLSVLVVDDNEVNRMVLGAFLKKSDISFKEVDNGYSAMEIIRSGGIDVVLMDIQMPDISGIEVVRKLREEQIELPVLVAVTAHAFPEQRQAILDAGFSDFLIKPISEAELLKTMARAYFGGCEDKTREISSVQ